MTQAFWPGRFQPPTVAHLETALTIIRHKRWQHLLIGVVYNVPRPPEMDSRWDDYMKQSDETAFGPGKIIFTAAEVVEMWQACLGAYGLTAHASVVATPRIQHNLRLNEEYPPEHFDYIVPTLPGDVGAMDALRLTLYPQLLGRSIATVMPSFVLHNTRIRALITAGERSWRDVIPDGAYDVFVRLNGAARIAHAESRRELVNV